MVIVILQIQYHQVL